MSLPPYPSGLPPSPPIWHANGSGDHGQNLGIGLMIGEIRSAAHHTHLRLDRIDHRLEQGDHRMGEITERIAVLEKKPTETIPAIERLFKDMIRYGVLAWTAWATGSIEAAIKLFGALPR